LQRIGIIGGMFDPVHNGHLRIAVECKEALELDELRMVPCAVPPHRDAPSVSPKYRVAMLQVALDNVEGISVDDRELQREGSSYTVDTLRSLKQEFPHVSFQLIIGSDAFQYLNCWHEWEELLKLANIVVAKRPDYQESKDSEVGKLLKQYFVSDLSEFKKSMAGSIFFLRVSQLEISSTRIRKLLKHQRPAKFLVPDNVLNYIKKNKLYC